MKMTIVYVVLQRDRNNIVQTDMVFGNMIDAKRYTARMNKNKGEQKIYYVEKCYAKTEQ